MLFKNKNAAGSYFRLLGMCYAGSLPGKTVGGKTHVINILYSLDSSRSPAGGISKIILSISDKKPNINVPNVKVSPSRRFAQSLQSINSNLKSLNSNNSSNSHEYGVNNISFPDRKNLNTSFALLDPFSSNSKKNNNLGNFLGRKVDEGTNGDASVFIGITSPFVKYGQRISTKLVSTSDPGSTVPSPITISSEGVAATVNISSDMLSKIDDLDAEALTSHGGYPYYSDGTFNKASVGPQSQVSKASLSRQENIPGISNPIGDLISETKIKVASDRVGNRFSSSQNIYSKKSYSEACLDSALEDKIDPARSAIIAPIITPGIQALDGLRLSSEGSQSETVYESKTQIKKSENQVLIKEGVNTIRRLVLDKVSDIPKNNRFSQVFIRPDTTAEVSQMIPINSAYASSYNTLYAIVKVYSGDGTIFQEKDFEINLRQIVDDGDIPTVPPKIDASPIKPGVIGITVSQVDKNADSIEIYCRDINRSPSQDRSWKKISEISLTSEEGQQYLEHTPQTACSILYRAISKTEGKRSSNFNSVICQPEDSFKKVVNQIKPDAAICSYINQNGNIEITLSNIRGGGQYLELRRRNVTNFEKFFTRINTSGYQGQFANNGESITFIDTSAEDGKLYEYKVFSTSFDGITTECFRTTIIEFIKPIEDVIISARNPSPLGNAYSSQTTTNVAIPVDVKVDSSEKNFISRLFENSGIDQSDLDLVPDIFTKIDQSLGVNINRIDETTGDQAYLGFFPTSDESTSIFIDKGDASLGIPAPSVGRVYKYIMEAVVLDLASIVSDSKAREQPADKSIKLSKSAAKVQRQRDKNDLTFTNDSTSGVTVDPKNPNRPEKFFNKRTLGKGLDAGVLLAASESTSQEIDLSRTGVYTVVTSDLTVRSKPVITNGVCKVRTDGKVHIEWSAQRANQIDHFLIKETRYGNTRVCLSAHNVSNKGKYSIIDFNARHTPGTVTYSIVPVSLEYQLGDEYTVGTVDILPKNFDAITVTKDLPDDLSTSNAGSFEYPEI